MTIATSTAGASPALARKFREQLSSSCPCRLIEYADLTPILSEARTELKRRGVKVRSDHWQACITEELLNLVQMGRVDDAKQALISDLLADGAGISEDP